MHVAKYKGNQTGALLAHDMRANRNYGNKEIDRDKSHQNYNLAPDRDRSPQEYLSQRIDEVKHLNRADVVRMVSVAVTLPHGYEEHSREFFSAAYNALSDRYGGEGDRNVIAAYVHKDETRDHMHFCFAPIVTDRDGHERLCCKEIVNREDLRTLHTDIERDVNKQLRERELPPISLINGAVREHGYNRDFREYKSDQYERECRDLDRQIGIAKDQATKFIAKEQERADNAADRVNDYIERIEKDLQELRRHVEPTRNGLFGRTDYKSAYERECIEHENTKAEKITIEDRYRDLEERNRDLAEKCRNLAEKSEKAEHNRQLEYEERLSYQERWSDRDALEERLRELDRDDRDREREHEHHH